MQRLFLNRSAVSHFAWAASVFTLEGHRELLQAAKAGRGGDIGDVGVAVGKQMQGASEPQFAQVLVDGFIFHAFKQLIETVHAKIEAALKFVFGNWTVDVILNDLLDFADLAGGVVDGHVASLEMKQSRGEVKLQEFFHQLAQA